LALQAPWRIGIDVGGTFTDLVIADSAGSIHVRKVASTPDDPRRGVIRGLDAAARELALSTGELLGACSHLVHGSTVATNIVVERKGARIGMLVTDGFRDSLEIRRGIRRNAWDHRTAFPPVLVPRYLRRPIRGRLDRHGLEIEPLSLEDVREAAKLFREEGIEAVAICLFNSFLSDQHEIAAASVIRSELPNVPVTLSSEIAPVMGEYERASTAALNAYVAPRVSSYVRQLERSLRELGFRRPLLMVQNNGGTITAERVVERPVSLLLSGPAAGIGALALIGENFSPANLISMEIGGTSCDVSVLDRGRAELTSEFELGGYHVALSSVGIHSIGAGGGTIAGADRAGMIFVGPRGAGADPGPASYGRGGREPTATDAQLVLGRLRPGPLGAGECSLDIVLARQAIEQRLATPLGVSIEAAAAGIVRLLEQQLFHAVQRMSAERGHDPRGFVLVAAGGAGPMHGYSIGRKLGARLVYVPRLAGAFCALGMLNAPIRHEYGRAWLGALGSDTGGVLAAPVGELIAQAQGQLTDDGFAADDSHTSLELELRYPGQISALPVPAGLGERFDWTRVRHEFWNLHERVYGHRQETTVEVAGMRVVGVGRFPPLRLAARAATSEIIIADEVRDVFFEETGEFVRTNIYAGAHLGCGARVRGPAVIEESTTTVVVGPSGTLEVDKLGNFVIRIEDDSCA
jgi:N-methylhydantoinase A